MMETQTAVPQTAFELEERVGRVQDDASLQTRLAL